MGPRTPSLGGIALGGSGKDEFEAKAREAAKEPAASELGTRGNRPAKTDGEPAGVSSARRRELAEVLRGGGRGAVVAAVALRESLARNCYAPQTLKGCRGLSDCGEVLQERLECLEREDHFGIGMHVDELIFDDEARLAVGSGKGEKCCFLVDVEEELNEVGGEETGLSAVSVDGEPLGIKYEVCKGWSLKGDGNIVKIRHSCPRA